jgi:hypothetical protein
VLICCWLDRDGGPSRHFSREGKAAQHSLLKGLGKKSVSENPSLRDAIAKSSPTCLVIRKSGEGCVGVATNTFFPTTILEKERYEGC